MKKIGEFLNESQGYEEFKYIIQDSGSYYMGAKYTFMELMEEEATPFKFKAIIEHYISKNTDIESTLESILYYMDSNDFTYKTLVQLKAKVKVSILVEKKKLFSKEKKYVYEERILSISELVDMNLAKKKGSGLIIRELIISKLALMGFSV